MRYLAFIVGIIIVVALVYLTFLQSNMGPLGFEGSILPDFLPVAGLAAVMAIGIFFGAMFRRMGTVDRKVNVINEAKDVLQSSSFIAALCVSPLVFFLAFLSVRGSPGDPASFLLAFQNGFFCEAIFRRMFRDDGTISAPPPQSPETQQ
ncbi:hypothetical protein [Ensifer aridi]|uniref:hypothetical protein n=1 Tax=Ensifer aridi TaxID=1708715 RepID=UPI00358E6FBA